MNPHDALAKLDIAASLANLLIKRPAEEMRQCTAVLADVINQRDALLAEKQAAAPKPEAVL